MAQTQTLQFELVSPEARVMDMPAAMVVLPAELGDIGVLADHAPLVTTIRPGVVNIYKDNMDQISDQVFIAGGFADITGRAVTLLAEEAAPLTALNEEETRAELETLRQDLENTATELEKTMLTEQIEILEAKLYAITQKK